MLLVFEEGELYLALPLCQLLSEVSEKLGRGMLGEIHTCHTYTTFCNRSIPTLNNKQPGSQGRLFILEVKFELGLEVHLPSISPPWYQF